MPERIGGIRCPIHAGGFWIRPPWLAVRVLPRFLIGRYMSPTTASVSIRETSHTGTAQPDATFGHTATLLQLHLVGSSGITTDFLLKLASLPQLTLDGFELLPQEVFPLALVDFKRFRCLSRLSGTGGGGRSGRFHSFGCRRIFSGTNDPSGETRPWVTRLWRWG